MSGDNNTSLVRVEAGNKTLAMVIIGFKCETSIAGRNEPAILLDGTALDEPSMTIIGGTATGAQSSTDLIKSQNASWGLCVQGFYIDGGTYTNAINDVVNTKTIPVAELDRLQLFAYATDAGNNVLRIGRGHLDLSNNARLQWQNAAGTDVGIMRVGVTDTTDISMASATGLRLMTAGFAATLATLIATNFNLEGVSLSTDTITLAADATPSVAGGNVFKTNGANAITDFDDGVVGQTIKIVCDTTGITITDNASIQLAGGNYAMTDTDTLTLTMYTNTIWTEDARSVN